MRVAARVGAVVGAAGFVVALAAATIGMHDLMAQTGGACATGGPYEVAQECPGGPTAMLVGGLAGGVVAALVFAGCAAAAGWPVLGPALAMWGATFAAFGWNFVDLGVLNPPDGDVAIGWAVSGALFWAMALAGLVPAIVMGVGRLRRGSAPPEPVFTAGPLVRAAVLEDPRERRH